MDDFLKVTSTGARDLTPKPFPSQLVTHSAGPLITFAFLSLTDVTSDVCIVWQRK